MANGIGLLSALVRHVDFPLPCICTCVLCRYHRGKHDPTVGVGLDRVLAGIRFASLSNCFLPDIVSCVDIQIIGTRKCRETQRAERYFKERGRTYHFLDLSERPLSQGELRNITRMRDAMSLIDTEGKEFARRRLVYMEYDPFEEILEHPLLLKTPIVRCGTNVSVGYAPDEWKAWLSG